MILFDLQCEKNHKFECWFASSANYEEQLKNIESLALEEQVTELLISQSKPEEESLSFEEVMTMS